MSKFDNRVIDEQAGYIAGLEAEAGRLRAENARLRDASRTLHRRCQEAEKSAAAEARHFRGVANQVDGALRVLRQTNRSLRSHVLDPIRSAHAEALREVDRLRREVATLRDGPTDAPAIPDGEPWPVVLGYVEWCANSWMPGARLLGNARAQDIARACREAIDATDISNTTTNAEASTDGQLP